MDELCFDSPLWGRGVSGSFQRNKLMLFGLFLFDFLQKHNSDLIVLASIVIKWTRFLAPKSLY